MSLCQAKRGFFTLYDCPKEAVNTCSGCDRTLCLEHFPQKNKKCLECLAAEVKNTKDVAVKSYQERHKTLSHEGTASIYIGSDLTSFYDQYDLRSFDIELSNIGDMADSPDEIFFDS